MSQIGAPGWQQALPERLVCNWKEGGKTTVNLTAKGSQRGQDRLSTALIPAESLPPALGVWRDCPRHVPLSRDRDSAHTASLALQTGWAGGGGMGSPRSLRAPGPWACPAWLEVLLSNPGKAPDLLFWLNSNCQATLPWGLLGAASFSHLCNPAPAQRYYSHSSNAMK